MTKKPEDSGYEIDDPSTSAHLIGPCKFELHNGQCLTFPVYIAKKTVKSVIAPGT